MRKQLTTAKESFNLQTPKMDIFPLPASRTDPVIFSNVLHGLNDLAGCAPEPGDDLPSEVQEMVKKQLRLVVERFDVWSCPKPEISFQKLFTTKDIDYTGEEIKVAMPLNWKGVQQSLPDGVGLLPLQDFCSRGTLDYVTNFEKHLLPMEDMQGA